MKAATLFAAAGIKDVEFGAGVRVIRPVNLYGCRIGDRSFVGPFCEIQRGATIGRDCRIQSHSFICDLVTIGDSCFIGHGVVFVNDTFSEGGPAGGDRAKWRSTVVGNSVSIGSNATVLLRFRSGALGVIEATTAARPTDLEGSISVLGERGTVEIGGFAVNEMKAWRFSEPEPEDEHVFERYSVNPPNVCGFWHKAYYDHVVDCIRHDRPQLVDGLEGRRSVELISAIYESIETGREVRLRFRPERCKLGIAG